MPYAKALIPLGLFLAGLVVGWSWTAARWDAAIAEMRLDLAEQRMNAVLNNHTIERLQVVADNALAEVAAVAAAKHERRVEYVAKEVVKYVQSPDAGRCAAADSWVRAYNAGWDDGLPGAEDATSPGDADPARVRAHADEVHGRGTAAGRGEEQPEPPQNIRHAAAPAGMGSGGKK